MRGDILLFRGESWRDRYVCAFTDGPYCHCEIDLGGSASIGVHLEDGLAYRWNHLPDRRTVIPISQLTQPDRIEVGIAWVLKQIGEPFSWASLADLAAPEPLGTLIFGRAHRYNCANLVAYYLEIAGGLPLTHGKRPPHILSPNDIARSAGLLPEHALATSGPIRMLTALAHTLRHS